MLFRKLCMLQDSKRSFYSLSFFNVFGLLLTMAVDSTSSTSSYKTLLDTMNDVGTELGNTLHNKETSFVVSVPSANILLGLLYAGAGGVTANELEKYFKLSNPKSHSLDLFEKFISSLMIQGVSVANAVYLAENFEPKPDFRQIGENQFKVAVEKLDFSNKVESANTINSWVMNKTENLIKDLIQKEDIDENVKMILVNAIHFKAKWLNKFKSAYSRNGDFHVTESKKITVKLMEQTSYFQYSEDSHYQYLIMPYEVQNLSMVIILPKNLKTFYENPFPKFNLDTSRFETHRVQVVLPKFKIESKIDFVNFLQTYIPSVFNSKTANLTGISDEELFVSKMFQKAFIKVDEEGTEAAAATVLMMSFMSAFHQETPKPFIVDRPFYFGLTAKLESTHTLLFHGAVVEPKF